MTIFNTLFCSRLPVADLSHSRAYRNLFALPVDVSSIVSGFDPSSVNAWSVDGNTINSPDLAANLFAGSLLPYLAFLYFLSRPATNTPRLGNFGFQFLLFFVFATIPAGIAAKIYYNDILANVDTLHGCAESMLTLTNLFIVYGFRKPRAAYYPDNFASTLPNSAFSLNGFENFIVAVGAILCFGFATHNLHIIPHAEPANALSLPTWMVHTSSLLEWLVAMKLIWEYGDLSNNPRWKGLTWAMIPSHASGICACTYHLFYNPAVFAWIVNMQAGLTCIGNAALAFAAFRIYEYAKTSDSNSEENETVISDDANHVESKQFEFFKDDVTDFAFITNLLAKTLISAVLAKYGELYFDFPFELSSLLALSIILMPTLVNVGKWGFRSLNNESVSRLPINQSEL